MTTLETGIVVYIAGVITGAFGAWLINPWKMEK
jgi:hypothetical protein